MRPGELVDVHSLGPVLAAARTTTLVKSMTLEVSRLVVSAGQEVTLRRLEGGVAIPVRGDPRVLEAGQLLCLIQDPSVLVTIQLH